MSRTSSLDVFNCSLFSVCLWWEILWEIEWHSSHNPWCYETVLHKDTRPVVWRSFLLRAFLWGIPGYLCRSVSGAQRKCAVKVWGTGRTCDEVCIHFIQSIIQSVWVYSREIGLKYELLFYSNNESWHENIQYCGGESQQKYVFKVFHYLFCPLECSTVQNNSRMNIIVNSHFTQNHLC